MDLITCQGEPSILGIARNIADKKRTEMALRTANKKLNLLSRMTRHDITNKITIQLGLLALEKRKIQDAPKRAALIGKLELAAQAIRDQIAFARICQDLGTQEPWWQDLHEGLAGIAVSPQSARIRVPAPRSLPISCSGRCLEISSKTRSAMGGT